MCQQKPNGKKVMGFWHIKSLGFKKTKPKKISNCGLFKYKKENHRNTVHRDMYDKGFVQIGVREQFHTILQGHDLRKVQHPIDIKINHLPWGLLADPSPAFLGSLLLPSNLFRRLGTSALLPGNLGNPHLDNLVCSRGGHLPRFHHL